MLHCYFLYGSCHQSMRTLLNLQYLTNFHTTYIIQLLHSRGEKKSKNQRRWLWRCTVKDKKTTISSTTLKLTFSGAKHSTKKKILFNIKRTKTTIVIIFCWYMKIQYMKQLLGSPSDLEKRCACKIRISLPSNVINCCERNMIMSG